MPNSDAQNRYKPVNCWKCGARNNFSQTRRCLQCGAALKLSSPRVDTPKRNPLDAALRFIIRTFLTIVIVSLLIVSGIKVYAVYFEKKDAVELPPNAWHQPTLANWYRQRPTVQEIIEKNDQVTSTTLRPSDVKTLSAKGQMSIALGFCVTKECSSKEITDDWGNRLRERFNQKYSRTPKPRLKKPKEISPGNPQISDDPSILEFEDFGEIEMRRKGANKLFRRSFITSKYLDERTETIEVFNGSAGWEEEIIYARDKITGETRDPIRRSVKELNGKALEDLKKSVTNLGNDFTGKTFNYSHTAKINDNVHFALRVDGGETSEMLYFDAVTGLLTKTDAGEFNCLMFPYADYDGVKLPTNMYFRKQNEEGRMMWMRIENIEWQINQPLEDSIFEKKPQTNS